MLHYHEVIKGTERETFEGKERICNVIKTEVDKRKTMAIISHPDAGKTTLTEKLLLFGGAIHEAGMVKGKKNSKFATSDWMEIEKQRGISVTSSVMEFDYDGFRINILDTPGHEDFSEDTYRTLTAADSAVMLIDGAKGVEAQTKKLFEVCSQRGIPIFTFVNKMDRETRDPFELMEELEEVLGMRSYPMNWPIGSGIDFQGIYDRKNKYVELFDSDDAKKVRVHKVEDVEDALLTDLLGEEAHQKLIEDIQLLDIAGDAYDDEKIQKGDLTPSFFGSALSNFGVQTFLEHFLNIAPAPVERVSSIGPINPADQKFSGYIFKIQANMNPAHRDRIAFLRICSGKFERGMSVKHPRLKKSVKLSQPQQFLAQERNIVQDAYAGDIIGLFDPGIFQIGDTLCEGQTFTYDEMPNFAPEHFARVSIKNALKKKQFLKGLQQLTEEGTVQFFEGTTGIEEMMIGVVGELQFEVFEYRMKHEYNVDMSLQRLPYQIARWVDGDFKPSAFQVSNAKPAKDKEGRPVVLFENEFNLRWASERFPDLAFYSQSHFHYGKK
ncbi:peptide chain release factor 3 [Caldalkalibacillus salinus]|uniref:peptide chain release factor 3 n=1 Tax=Caldalkalibacillus salinus TaxID=2803787 RepID=UPI001922384F|nr:peptide chain release factor 3 [Caldalkalibacillus salinus]